MYKRLVFVCLYVCLSVCVFVCLFAKNSKTTRRINLKYSVYTIYDNGSIISYLKLASEVACYFLFIFFQIFHQKQTSVLIFKLSQAMYCVMIRHKPID